MRRVTAAGLIIIGCLMGSLPRVAQAQPASDPRTTAKMHVGPFYLTPRIALRGLGVDNNIYNSAGERDRDFTFELVPHVDAWVPLRRFLFGIVAEPSYTFYRAHTEERSFNNALTLRAEVPFRRVTFFVSDSFVSTRERPNFEIDVRVRRSGNSLEAGLDLRLLSKLSLQVSGGSQREEYDPDAVYFGTFLHKTLNRTSTVRNATLNYRLTPVTALVLRGELIRDRFPMSPVRDSNTVRLLPGVAFTLGGLLSGSAYVGYRRLAALNPELPNFRGPVAEVDITYRVLPSMDLRFSVERDINYSFKQSQPYYVINGFGMSVRREVTGRTEITFGAIQQHYDYQFLLANPGPDGDTIATTLSDRKQRTRNYTISFGYFLGRETRADFGVQYWTRRDRPTGIRDFTGLHVLTNIVYGVQR